MLLSVKGIVKYEHWKIISFNVSSRKKAYLTFSKELWLG